MISLKKLHHNKFIDQHYYLVNKEQ